MAVHDERNMIEPADCPSGCYLLQALHSRNKRLRVHCGDRKGSGEEIGLTAFIKHKDAATPFEHSSDCRIVQCGSHASIVYDLVGLSICDMGAVYEDTANQNLSHGVKMKASRAEADIPMRVQFEGVRADLSAIRGDQNVCSISTCKCNHDISLV